MSNTERKKRHAEAQRRWSLANPEKAKENARRSQQLRSRERANLASRLWRQRHPERAKEVNAKYEASRGKAVSRARHLRKTFGLTVDAFNLLLAGQDNCCAVCRTNEPNAHGWCVDHDHRNGNVRGVLCSSCNTGIGLLQDSPAVLLAAVDYLKRSVL